jgi:dihydroorotate dehydrogenase (fumarate)
MTDLSTSYMGIALKNPIIVGASNMSLKVENLRKIEQAGAAAVVYKSLFEEQIQLESIQLQDELDLYNERHAEMIKLFPDMEHAGPQEFLMNLRNARKEIKIPLIASLNAVYKETWLEYCKLLEGTGVDAIELNFYSVPQDMTLDSASIEKQQVEILQSIKKTIKIPVSVKLSSFYTNPLNMISKLDAAGTNGFVLFNRLFQPDIDIDKIQHTTPLHLSTEEDNRLPLRYAGLLYKNIKGSICSNTGIFTGKDVIKMILAGADCVQVVSTVYKHKMEVIGKMLTEIEEWMKANKFNKLADFRGKLSRNSIKDPFIYKRAQYVDLIMKSEEIVKKYPMV